MEPIFDPELTAAPRESERRLQEILAALSNNRDLYEILRLVRDAVMAISGFDRAGVQMIDADGAHQINCWGIDLEGNSIDYQRERRPLSPITARLLSPDCPFLLLKDLDFSSVLPDDWTGLTHVDNGRLPLRAGTKILGILSVDNILTGRPITVDELTTLLPFCDAAAAAIQTWRLKDDAASWARERSEQAAVLDTILESAPVGFAFLDNDLRYVRINRFLARINGLSVEEHLGKTPSEVMPNYGPHIEPVLRRILQTQQPLLNIETSVSRPNRPGGTREYELNLYPVRTNEGEVLGVGVFVSEITERRRAEAERAQAVEALMQSEERFRAIFENTVEAIGVSCDQRHVQCNAAYAALFGYASPDELIAVPIVDLIAPDTRVAMLDRAQRRARGEELPSVYESRGLRRDGTEFDMEMHVSTYRSDDQVFTIVLVRDITARKRTEIERENQLRRERKVAQTLQHALLLTAAEHEFAGVDVAPIFVPISDEALIGGDFYDMFAVEGGQIAFVVGDVSGKGLAAASRTAEVKFVLRAFLRESPEDPGRAISRLNDFLCESQELDRRTGEGFLVLATAVLDVETGVTRIAVAGAEPPLLLRAPGSARTDDEDLSRAIEDATGMALGIQRGEAYRPVTVTLAPEDQIILLTDGITEAKHPSGTFLGYDGFQRIAREIDSTPGDDGGRPDVEAIAEAILDGARRFTGTNGHLHDDVCLLVVRRR